MITSTKNSDAKYGTAGSVFRTNTPIANKIHTYKSKVRINNIWSEAIRHSWDFGTVVCLIGAINLDSTK